MDREVYKRKCSNWMHEFHQHLDENIENPLLTNEYLAGLMGISERKFYRKVKKITGLTPNIYIRIIKLEKAHQLLYSGDCPNIKEVLPKIGLTSLKYFYLIFKKQFGYSPGSILKKGQVVA